MPNNNETPRKMLFIENNTLLIHEVDVTSLNFVSGSGTKIKGILGIIQIYPTSYLFVITGHKLVYEVNIPQRVRIYEITDTDLIVINKDGSENLEYKNAIKKIMKFGFYYSPDADLTQRLNLNKNEEGKEERKSEIIKDIPKYKLEDLEDQDKFWWNKRLYQGMELCCISEDPWKIRMIRGHVGQEEIFIGSRALMGVTLISRKATLMGGIIDTGIDDDGSVANFVETEQWIEIDK